MLHFFQKLRKIRKYQIIRCNLSLASSNLFFFWCWNSAFISSVTCSLARCFVVAFFSRQRVSKYFFLDFFHFLVQKIPEV
jgi:ABC-type maltose transport system permease subunit